MRCILFNLLLLSLSRFWLAIHGLTFKPLWSDSLRVERPKKIDPCVEKRDLWMVSERCNNCVYDRRDIFESMGFPVAALLGTLLFKPRDASAAAPLNAGEAIRRGASGIPGLGPSDIFFPQSLLGTWFVNRDVEFGGDSSGKQLRLSYPFRFIQSIEDGSVVADRGANQAALEQALIEAVVARSKGKEESTEGSKASESPSSFVQSYDWTPTNPNDLRLAMSDGSKKEIKVTKRAILESTDSMIYTSEFQRITLEDPSRGGIPVLSARRVVTKWYLRNDSTLEGLEVVYNMGSGDPLLGINGGSSPSPEILSKSRLVLVRR